jgi:predicted metal-binding membrane protein
MTHHSIHGSGALAISALGWTAMMAVMMAPTVAPWVTAFYRFGLATGEKASRLRSALLFLSGYFAVWSLFGLAIALAQASIEFPAEWSGGILIGAGVFQFTPMKQACLTHCRNPFSFLLTRWNDGPRSAVDLGLRHGVYCLGCCWALMLTSLAVGFMSLWWMAALAFVTFVEQATPWGAHLRVPIGLGLIAVGFSL